MLATPDALGLFIACRATHNAIQVDLVSVPVKREWRLSLCWIYDGSPEITPRSSCLALHASTLLVSHTINHIIET